MSRPHVFLHDYLDEVLAAPWSWGGLNGGFDCCFFAGNWIRAATARDPLEPYRGKYANALSARRLIAAKGGLKTMIGVEMSRCGFEPTERAEHGDVGVFEMNLQSDFYLTSRDTAMIKDGPWWVGLSFDGIVAAPIKPSIAWRVL